jgi:glycosyltransferase involved in cell wall biosynthesis
MIVYDMLEFGGLEEFTKNLAIGIMKQGHPVSIISTSWVKPDNQYLRSMLQHGITFVQLPKWLSRLVSDWTAKERILSLCLRVLAPVVLLLGCVVALSRRRALKLSIASARNWLRGQLMNRLIGPDRRKPLIRLLLSWWNIRWHPDIFHIQGYTSTLLFAIDWAHQKHIPIIYEEHQTPDFQFDWWKDFQRTINKATLVIAVSETSAQALQRVCSVTCPIATVYYMVPDPYESGWTPEAHDTTAGLVRITTPARLYITKGLTYLLEAITRVKAVHPAVEFKVYGDGEMRQELLSYAKQLGLDGNQIFVGPYTSREELFRIMARTDIFVMSSVLEGLPIALLEAMSHGLPIIATPVGGIPEAIIDGVNGLLCPPRNPQCLAEKICALIENPDLRLKLGLAARNSYLKGPYRPASVCSQYISIYRSLLASKANQLPSIAAETHEAEQKLGS